jgi:hypothetical protein
MLGWRVLLALVPALGSLWLACAAPPPAAAEYPQAPRKVTTAPVPAATERCGLVRRAARTWVGFAEGMSADEMLPAGQAAGEVVQALDAAFCGLRRGERPAALLGERERLRSAAADGGRFEVTAVLWQDAEMTRAEVELHARSTRWSASVVRAEERWDIAALTLR